MKKYLLYLVLCYGFHSCEPAHNYEFWVYNQTDQNLYLNISEPPSYSTVKETSFVLAAGTKVLVFFEHGGMGLVPDDRYCYQEMQLPPGIEFELLTDEEPITEEIRRRKFWDFTAEKYLGTYMLNVTPELVGRLNSGE